MTDAVVELRRYRLHPGRRDELITLFEDELIEPQEACGIAVLGQFRDLDRPDDFVWLRAFSSMADRPVALARFYDGPAWAAHRDAANATMIDSDDVLLLRPLGEDAGDGSEDPSRSDGLVVATIWTAPRGQRSALLERFEGSAPPGVLATFITCEEANNYPRLPVHEDVDALVVLSRDSAPAVDAEWRDIGGRMERLRLAPTRRSALR